jgi:[FeFe] hydrogenase H-cluster maturation GTPase HydF
MTVLVIPIDESAPKGRLILPQQLVMRDLLDHGYAFSSCRPEELADTLASFKKAPALVVTDSQAFAEVSKIVPEDVALTSFSILMARYKGELTRLVEGANKLSELKDGSRVLISEGCTHHRQCNDIGTVKLPKLIRKFTGREIELDFTSGREFPTDLSSYDLIVHCGGCMLNDKEMQRRVRTAAEAGVPIVNYGVAIAKMNGILDRSLEPVQKSM